MDTCTQLSVFLANKPGVLTQVFHEMAKGKVNITTIAMMDSMEHGVLRMIVDDAGLARNILQKINVPFTESEVLAISLPNRPGAAADLCDRLSSAHIHIGYMYCTAGASGGKTTVVLKVPSIKKAIKVLGNSKATRRDMKVKLRRPAPVPRR